MALPKFKEEAKVIQIRLPFIIPTEKEVKDYMMERQNYPESFATHYAEKFWNFYQSKAWKVGNQPMKDWKACFNGQWKVIKDQRDELLLTNALKKEIKEKPKEVQSTQDQTISYLNDILSQYAKHPTWIEESSLIPIYDHLKAQNGFKLNQEEVKICRGMGESKGKAQAVKFLMDKMIKENRRFI